MVYSWQCKEVATKGDLKMEGEALRPSDMVVDGGVKEMKVFCDDQLLV